MFILLFLQEFKYALPTHFFATTTWEANWAEDDLNSLSKTSWMKMELNLGLPGISLTP